MPRSLALAIAKEREATNLSNNFDYGLDAKGGAKAGKEPVDANELKACLDKSVLNARQKEENKAHIEKQNFNMIPEKKLANSETKYIGMHQGRGISNPIDLDGLKRSNVPFGHKDSVNSNS